MAEVLVELVLIAALGSLAVPAAMLALARLGLFEPLVITVLGRTFTFAPHAREQRNFFALGALVPAGVTWSAGTAENFPRRQTAFVSAVTTVLTVAAPGAIIKQASTTAFSSGSVIERSF